MKAFLRKLKLIEDFSTTITMDRGTFVNKLKNYVDEDRGGFEVFSRCTKEFKGQVGYDSFKIRRRRRIFDVNMNGAVAEGTYRQSGASLIIEAEVRSFHGVMIPLYLFLILFYIGFISAFFFIGDLHIQVIVLLISVGLVHGGLMFGIPYIMMRRSLARMKYELEREFYYMAK